MATTTFYKGQNIVLVVDDASVTGQTFQLTDLAGVEIGAANIGFFWKVNSISFTATQNVTEKPHVGTDEQDTIATTKTYDVSVDADWYTADGDVTLVGTTTTAHAIDMVSLLKQVINGDGETYSARLYVGCDLKTDAANGEEDYADLDTADFSIDMSDVIFTNAPFSANPGEISSGSFTMTVKSADIL